MDERTLSAAIRKKANRRAAAERTNTRPPDHKSPQHATFSSCGISFSQEESPSFRAEEDVKQRHQQ